jgi:halimadienyl-diphosphate synthase
MVTGALWERRDEQAVRDLVQIVADDPLGQVSPSVYETARLVVLAPWLSGHAERIRFLLSAQQPDGSWGAPDGYGFVPTLSATDALLRCGEQEAAQRGLTWLAKTPASVPDTIAVELIVPWLANELGVALPGNIGDRILAKLRGLVRSGLPEKAWHSLEAFGADACNAAVQPVNGVVCGSAAATAAWLGERRAGHESVAFLERLQARGGGPVPGVAPIDVFEPAWVAAALADAGLDVPPDLVTGLEKALADGAIGAGTGLPADADDTAGALYALAKLGKQGDASPLWSYEGEDYFRCFEGEQTPSISTNAHILDAIGAQAPDQAAAIGKITRYLRDTQEDDGSWWDKWHASPFYATACCTLALHRAGDTDAVASAVGWVRRTQREDGTWGRWQGTVEETAYAVQILLHCGEQRDHAAALRAAEFLREETELPPLWHDKDLYTPIAVVQAARLSALRLLAMAGER